jgi:hypothetical protein
VVGLWMSNSCQEIMSPPSLFKCFLRQRNVFSLRSREGHHVLMFRHPKCWSTWSVMIVCDYKLGPYDISDQVDQGIPVRSAGVLDESAEDICQVRTTRSLSKMNASQNPEVPLVFHEMDILESVFGVWSTASETPAEKGVLRFDKWCFARSLSQYAQSKMNCQSP